MTPLNPLLCQTSSLWQCLTLLPSACIISVLFCCWDISRLKKSVRLFLIPRFSNTDTGTTESLLQVYKVVANKSLHPCSFLSTQAFTMSFCPLLCSSLIPHTHTHRKITWHEERSWYSRHLKECFRASVNLICRPASPVHCILSCSVRLTVFMTTYICTS